MKVVFNGDLESIQGLEVFLPRPVRRNILEEILKRASVVYMPPSTLQRSSKELVERYRHKIRVASVRGRFSKLPPEVIAQIAALRKSGLSIRKIAQETGLPKSTVHYVLTRLKKIDAGEKVIL